MEYTYNSNIPNRAPLPSPNAAATQTRAYEKYRVKERLQKAIGGAHEVLVTATTVFPFTLFPDTITIDRTKLSVAHRVFFRVAEVMTLRVEDILNVTANVGPFFGSLIISTRFFDKEKEPYKINYLTRADALKIKRIMQGYIIAMRQKIDCSALSTVELARMLDQLGQGAPEDEG